jgi:hypothetical protein
MADQDKLKKSQIENFNASFTKSVAHGVFSQEIRHTKEVKSLAGSKRCQSPIKMDQLQYIQDITKVSSHHQ